MDRRTQSRPALTFRPTYALATLLIFLVEVAIALFVKDRFVRPYIGDVLAVVLVYTALRAVTPLRVVPAAATAFAIAMAIEFGQLLGAIHWLGLGENRIARLVLGTGFDLHDFLAYATGALLALAVERLRRR